MDYANYWFSSGSGGGSGPVPPGRIAHSLRFRNEGSSASYRLRLTSTAQNGVVQTDRTTWSMSVWLKDIKGRDSSAQGTFFANHYRTSDSGYTSFETGRGDSQKPVIFFKNGGDVRTAGFWLRDSGAWCHHVLTAQNDSYVNWYVNGKLWQRLGTFNNNWWITPNNGGFQKIIGCGGNSSAQYWSGFRGAMAEFRFVDGRALDPTVFGEFDDNDIWISKEPTEISSVISGNSTGWGGGGYYLDFSDPNNLGADRSGNGHNFTPEGFDTNSSSDNYDCWSDSPTRNYAIMQPMFRGTNNPLVERGGTYMAGAGNWFGTVSTHVMHPGTGSYYMEIKCSDAYFGIGDITNAEPMRLLTNPALITGWAVFRANGNNCYVDQTTYASNAPQWSNVWAGFTIDTDNNTMRLDCPNGTFTMDYSGFSMADKPICCVYASYNGGYWINNGQTPWNRTQPAGTRLLSSEACGPDALFPRAKDVFNIALYSGNSGNNSVQTVGFQSDLIWFKSRSINYNNSLWDSSTNGYLCSDTGEPSAPANDLTVSSTGFTHTAASQRRNTSGESYVAWCWKKAAGFMDIVTYTGNGANRQINHNLGAEPRLMIVKSTSLNGPDWSVYHYSGGANSAFHLNRDSGNDVQSIFWNNTRPTSTQFTVSTSNTVNQLNETYVNYLFAEVPGVSRIGEFLGNSNSDGTFVLCGFRPMWVMIKRRHDTAGWTVYDQPRSGYKNGNWVVLYPNSPSQEGGSQNNQDIDFYANGFKIRCPWGNVNTNSNPYLFVAFADLSTGLNTSPTPANN